MLQAQLTIKVKEVKEVEFEGTKYFSLLQDGGLASPKWKISQEMYFNLMGEKVTEGDTLNITVSQKYNPKSNSLMHDQLIAFKKVK